MSGDRWDYGGAWRRHDMSGPIALPNDSMVQVADWTEAMPDFMRRADTLFVDPPWSAGNAKSFYTKAAIVVQRIDFAAFTASFFERVDEIGPRFLFVEIGKQHLGRYLCECERRFPYVTFYNSTYNRRSENKCYVIHATGDHARRRYPNLEDLGQAQIIEWICANHEYQCIGDLCMGRGRVGREAFRNGKPFVGTELNAKRLAVLVDFIRSYDVNRDRQHR